MSIVTPVLIEVFVVGFARYISPPSSPEDAVTFSFPAVLMSPVVVRVVIDALPVSSEASCEYFREVHAVEPLPTLNFSVSVSKPISPEARVGLVEVQLAAVSRLC
jgi:hypothetical protein